MKMTAFDKWLTTQPEGDDMTVVTKEGMTDYHEGLACPTYVDELQCEDCNKGIGWDSDGTFTEFYTDDRELHYKCEDCHDSWSRDED